MAALALALVAGACGSRVDDDKLAQGNDSTDGTAANTPSSQPAGNEGDVPMFGTLEAPCNEAPEGFEPTDSDTGVSADKIKIGVVSDRAGPVKVPTASIEETVTAFVQWCNDLGGINGRPLELLTYDTKFGEVQAATQAACDDGVFALVGSGQVLDDQGVRASLDCDLPDISAYSATAKKTLSPNVITPVPNPPTNNMVGPARYLADQFPEAAEAAAMISSEAVETAWTQALRAIDSYEGIVTFTQTVSTGIFQESYAAEARQLSNAGVRWVQMVSETGEGLKLLRDMDAQGFDPDVKFFGPQYYDPVLLTETYSEGAYVEINTVPFEEADDVSAMRQYLDIYDSIGSNIAPTSLGVQSFSASLLFATAARNAGADLTRANLEAELAKITSWDGGGLHYETNPADRSREGCFILMQIRDGAFTRVLPEEAGTFSCSPDNVAPVTDPKLNGSQVEG